MNSKEIYDYIIKIQSIAKIGLVYSKDPYALTNYQEINKLSLDFLSHFEEVKFDKPNYFTKNIYPTPNVSVRTVVLSSDKKKVLLVKECNSLLYSLPGGWCDLYDSPATSAINECRQEAGIDIEIERLIGVVNHVPFKNDTFECIPDYVVIFLAKQTSDFKEHEYETCDVRYFDVDNLPPLSRKSSKEEVMRMINAGINGDTIYD